jgi:hypothetical protein
VRSHGGFLEQRQHLDLGVEERRQNRMTPSANSLGEMETPRSTAKYCISELR